MYAMNTDNTQQLLERVSSLLRSESRSLLLEHGLQPVHFEVLHYLSRCNRYSDTPMAVTEYLGQTKGSVSQSLKVLEKKSLISKQADSKDKRATHLSLTKKGRELVQGALPSASVKAACGAMNNAEITALNTGLTSLLRAVQHKNSFKSFGQCFSCIHNVKLSPRKHMCGLTNEALTVAEVDYICREHEYASA